MRPENDAEEQMSKSIAWPIHEPEEPRIEMPSPSEGRLASPEFEAVWQCIKEWDINVPRAYVGYCGANGSHVELILQALDEINALPGQRGVE